MQFLSSDRVSSVAVIGSVVACGGEKVYNDGDILRELYGGSEEKSLG